MMKNHTLKRLLSFVMALSMTLSMAVMPAAATGETTETTEATEPTQAHECSFTTETARTEPTCVTAGSVTKACSCGETNTQELPATGTHTYENGICSVCSNPKPCSLALNCDAPQHVQECLSQASCTCTILCSENMLCPVCEAGGVCLGKGDEEEEDNEPSPPSNNPPACDGTENCPAQTHETTCDSYDWCAALGCGDTHHADCPWGPCTKTEGCDLVKNHPGDCTGMTTLETDTPPVKPDKLPTATVTPIDAPEDLPLTFALNFKADEADRQQLDYYGSWYADFVLTLNKGGTFNANGTVDGYLAGQYDGFGSDWLAVPDENVTLKADEPVKIMESAAALMDQPGLRFTYEAIYTLVNDFDCGVYLSNDYLANHPDLEITLELRMFNDKDESESYVIGETYEFVAPEVPRVAFIDANGNGTADVGEYYASLQSAFAKAKAGNTIKLVDSLSISTPIEVTKAVKLDLNSKILTNEVTDGCLFLTSADLTIQGTGTVDSAANKIAQGTGKLQIAGGTFKSGNTVADIKAYLSPGYQQNATTGAVSKAEMPAVGSSATSSVQTSSAPQATKDAVASITGNTAIKKANSGLDQVFTEEKLDEAVTLLKNDEDNADKDLSGTTIRTTVSVSLEEVETNEDESAVTVLSYDVKPQVQAVDTDGNVVASTDIPNEKLNNKTINFRLPIVGTDAGNLVSVSHNDSPIGVYTVQGTGSNLYIDVDTKSFSTFTVKILDSNAKEIAEVTISENRTFADLAEAITYLGTNTGKLKLLDSITTDDTFTIAASQSVEVDLNGKTYTYTGTAAAFQNSGTLTLNDTAATKGGITAISGTLANNVGTMTIVSNITYTSNSTTGNTIEGAGTVSIASGSFSGNAKSIFVTGQATISGGTFNKAVEGAVTINGGTFNDTVSTTVAIPGTVPGTSTGTTVPNPARFKLQPAEYMIQLHYSAVPDGNTTNPMYVIQENAYVLVTKSNTTTKVYYNDTDNKNLAEVLITEAPATFTLTRDEVFNTSLVLPTNQAITINLNGYKITGSGSITSNGKLFLKELGNGQHTLELDTGDKAAFSASGAVTATAAKKIVDGKTMSYGDVKVVKKSSSTGTDITTIYFLHDAASVTVDVDGKLNVTGEFIPQTSGDIPSYSLQITDGTNNTNTYIMGSSKTLVISSNGFYDDFSHVEVNGTTLSSSNYTLSEKDERVVVTLKNSYLRSLSKGKYPIVIHYKDGGRTDLLLQSNFYVAATTSIATNPKTGDTIMAAVAIMAVAAAGLGVLLYLGKKKKK